MNSPRRNHALATKTEGAADSKCIFHNTYIHTYRWGYRQGKLSQVKTQKAASQPITHAHTQEAQYRQTKQKKVSKGANIKPKNANAIKSKEKNY